ncbi:MAG: hypothetical protein ACREM2_08075 [Vulcanimicrobiaceae bacterium]
MSLVPRSLAALFVALLATAAAARASLPPRVELQAARVDFFPFAGGAVIAAHGGANVTVGETTIQADDVRYELGAERLVAAGDVQVVDDGTREPPAAAYLLDLASGRAWFERFDGEAAAASAPLPSDAFTVADLDGARPFLVARHALVLPGIEARFRPARFPSGAGPSVELPTYLWELNGNPELAASATSVGSSFDQPYPLFGSPGALATGHLRYDGSNGVTLGLDEHLVDRNRAYAIASVEPLRARQLDLVAFEQLRRGLQTQLSGYRLYGPGPYGGADHLQWQLQAVGPLASATLLASHDDASYADDASAEFDLVSNDRPLGKLLRYQLRAGYGYDHQDGGYPVLDDFRTTLGALVSSPSLALAGGSLSASDALTLVAYDYPHQAQSNTLSFGFARRFARGISLFANASFAQVDQRYRDPSVAARALGLPLPGYPFYAPDGALYPGYFAYAGLTTYRTYSGTLTFQDAGDNRFALTLTRDDDFPQFHGFGRPPFILGADLVRRLGGTLRVELGRSYDFGWDHQYLSPQWLFALSQ